MRFKLDPLSASGISVVSQITTISAGSGTSSGTGASVSDDAYAAGWDGDTTNAPSKNAVYDKIETMGGAGSGDVVGPAASVDFAIARFDGTTGKLLQDYTSGAPTISDTGAPTFQLGAVINEVGANSDTRIEGDTDVNLLFADASADKIGIGVATPLAKLTVNGGYAFGGSLPTSWASQVSGRLGIVSTNDTFYFDIFSSPYLGAEFSTYNYNTTATFPLVFQANGGNTLFGTTSGGSPGSLVAIRGNLNVGYVTEVAPSNGAIINGSVGIGTSSPDQKFEVNGIMSVEGGNGDLLFSSTTDGGDFNIYHAETGAKTLALYGTAGNTMNLNMLDGNINVDAGYIQGNHRLVAAPSADHSVSGVTMQLVANENQAIGDVCYINASGEAQLADADAIATSVVQVMCADATIAADATGNYLVMGVARDDTWAWTVGGLIYLSTTGTTGNTLTQTAPSGTDDCVVVVGVATHADRMLFRPSAQGIVEIV